MSLPDQSGFARLNETRAFESRLIVDTAEIALRNARANPIPGYEIESRLGNGACGVVYRAKQLKLDRIVALKTIELEWTEGDIAMVRFEKEAIALGKLQHPHIVNVFDSGKHEGRVYFAMELLQGMDLDDFIAKNGPLEERTAWSIARQTATALAHAAEIGLIHRDIKPANLFLVDPPTGFPLPPGVPMVKVTDFGLALDTVASAKGGARLTHVGTVVGTPIYMAPEQFNDADIDSRADIYALGATVHHMLDGAAPFDGKTIWEVMSKKIKPGSPPISARVSRASAELVAAMLHPEARTRIGTYLELLARIDALLIGLEPHQPARRAVLSPSRLVLGFALTASIAAASALPAVVRKWSSGSVPTGPRESVLAERFVSDGNFMPLFNNLNLEGLNTRGGQWAIEDDAAEPGKKLAGRGLLKVSLQRKAPFRLAVGIEIVGEGTVAELLVAKSRGPAERAVHYTVKIARSGVQLGKKVGETGNWEPIGTAATYPSAEQLGDSASYQSVEIEALGDRWIVKFRSTVLGTVLDDATLGLTEVNFSTTGRVRIESVILEGLKRAE